MKKLRETYSRSEKKSRKSNPVALQAEFWNGVSSVLIGVTILR